ncbi:MAG TPA: hypothetical protein VHA70_14365 [Bauldia sp.]|nr:hypothetical protein [Bauldia sp.]
MKRLGLLLAAGLGALGVDVAPASAGPLTQAQILHCEPNRADISSVAVNDLKFGVEATYVWASANIQLTKLDGSVRGYFVSGRAVPTDKQVRENKASAGFAYSGFTCSVTYRNIVSVRNCGGSRKARNCDIGVKIFGNPVVFAVTMTAEPTKIIEASSTP